MRSIFCTLFTLEPAARAASTCRQIVVVSALRYSNSKNLDTLGGPLPELTADQKDRNPAKNPGDHSTQRGRFPKKDAARDRQDEIKRGQNGRASTVVKCAKMTPIGQEAQRTKYGYQDPFSPSGKFQFALPVACNRPRYRRSGDADAKEAS